MQTASTKLKQQKPKKCFESSKYSFGSIEGDDLKAVVGAIIQEAEDASKVSELRELVEEIQAQFVERYTPRITDYNLQDGE